MKKIAEVEEAKAIMTEAQNWGIWRWLTEKRKVRLAADSCNDALARAEKRTIESWPDEMRTAYDELADGKTKKRGKKIDGEVMETVRKIKEALDEAERVRLDAEDIFDRADRALSTSMAKQGTFRAIEAWEMREKAIRKAESAAKKTFA